MDKKIINGNIIRILDKETVIVNLGYSQGVRPGSIINILGKPEEIYDPITKTNLGIINIVKAKVKATQVYDKFTIAKSSWPEFDLGVNFGFPASRYIKAGVDEMNVDEKDIKPWKAKSEEKISVGDVVETEVDMERNENEVGGKETSIEQENS